MDKEEKLYRINKAYSGIRDYTTLDPISKLECAIEEVIKVLEAIVEDEK